MTLPIKSLLFLIFSFNLFAASNYTHNTSKLIDDTVEIKATYSTSFEKYVALEELKAYGVELRLKPFDFYGLYINYEYNNITYKAFDLYNKKYELINKLNLYSSEKINFTMDLTYTRNTADDISITHNATLNKILKASGNNSISVKDDTVYIDEILLNVYDQYGNYIQPEVSIESVQSDSFKVKAYLGLKINEQHHLDLYLGAAKNIIKGNFTVYPEISFLDTKDLATSLNREEYVSIAGLTYLFNYSFFQTEINYEYNYFHREGENIYNNNQLLELVLNFNVLENVNIFTDAKYMTHQFMSDIPYSYNALTTDTFSRHYAFIEAGLIISF